MSQLCSTYGCSASYLHKILFPTYDSVQYAPYSILARAAPKAHNCNQLTVDSQFTQFFEDVKQHTTQTKALSQHSAEESTPTDEICIFHSWRWRKRAFKSFVCNRRDIHSHVCDDSVRHGGNLHKKKTTETERETFALDSNVNINFIALFFMILLLSLSLNCVWLKWQKKINYWYPISFSNLLFFFLFQSSFWWGVREINMSSFLKFKVRKINKIKMWENK